MASDDSQEALETLSSSFDNFIREPIGEDFAGERGDVNTSGFALENIAESFEIAVSSTDKRMSELERGDIGLYVLH